MDRSGPKGSAKTVAQIYAEVLDRAEADMKRRRKKKVRKPKPAVAYRPAVITFIDILGFSDLVARSENPTEISVKLRRLGSFAANGEDADDDVDETTAVVFSDSIVRVRYLDGIYRSGALFQEVLQLLHVQGEMLADDVLLRGGLTVGNIHVDGQMAFGPGFIRAYKLESEFANYPRIVIGPEVFTVLRGSRQLVAEHHDVPDEVHYLKQMLRRSDDGLWFIDYLYGMQGEMDRPETHPELVARHRKLIIENANAAKPDSRVLQKYLWLARYINDVSERLGLSEMMIAQADIPALEALDDEPEWAKPYSGPVAGSEDFDE